MQISGLFFILICLPSALLNFALPQWKGDPNFRIEDAYKWSYQATRGGEHAVPNEETARKYLGEEWQTLGAPAADEVLWQPLCADGSIGRLNLRPFRAQGGDQADLAAAFVKSSEDFTGDAADFLAVWRELGRRLKKKKQGELNYHDWKKLNAEMRKQNYPAIHHSKIYENAEHPAYRILTKAEADKIISNLE